MVEGLRLVDWWLVGLWNIPACVGHISAVLTCIHVIFSTAQEYPILLVHHSPSVTTRPTPRTQPLHEVKVATFEVDTKKTPDRNVRRGGHKKNTRPKREAKIAPVHVRFRSTPKMHQTARTAGVGDRVVLMYRFFKNRIFNA